MKKTVVIGASENPGRYSQMATASLQKHGYEVVPVGLKEGNIQGISILSLKNKPKIENVDTVTLYVGPLHQSAWFDYILSLKPKRVILNPGTENPEIEELLKKNDIDYTHACTLVLLSTGQY
ncbi:MAG TPA: CoA-binding protein [Bacteroidia bacterium]|nr:CoA-binding protein [Bacteroidia bacterium]